MSRDNVSFVDMGYASIAFGGSSVTRSAFWSEALDMLEIIVTCSACGEDFYREVFKASDNESVIKGAIRCKKLTFDHFTKSHPGLMP